MPVANAAELGEEAKSVNLSQPPCKDYAAEIAA